jgi:hypothetical protein
LFALLSFWLVTVAAGSAAQPSSPSLTVVGSASVSEPAARATLHFRIETANDVAREASRENENAARAVGAALLKANVPATAVGVSGYSVIYLPRPERPDPSLPNRYGYIVTRQITVQLAHIEDVGPAIDAGVASGLARMDGVNFLLRDPAAAQRSALVAAVADAQAQAQAIAHAAGLRLGKILSISTLTSPQAQPGGIRMLAVGAATQLQPSELTTQASVTIRFDVSR